MCRNEFSSTTIAASTIIPTPSARPPKVIVFERQPAEVEQREGADHRDRDRGADDQCRAEIPQEQEDDQDDQHRAEHHVLLHRVDRALDELRAVVEQRQMHAGHLAVDPLDLAADALRDLHRVGARLLGDLHADAGPTVDAENRPVVLGRVLHLGDVLEVDRDAGARHHDEVARSAAGSRTVPGCAAGRSGRPGRSRRSARSGSRC